MASDGRKHFTLKVIGQDPAGHSEDTVMIVGDPAAPDIEAVSFDCGSCGRPLIQDIPRSFGVTGGGGLGCAYCGALNEADITGFR